MSTAYPSVVATTFPRHTNCLLLQPRSKRKERNFRIMASSPSISTQNNSNPQAEGFSEKSAISSAFLGFDFGTSGARACVIDSYGSVLADIKQPYADSAESDWASSWENTLFHLISAIPHDICAKIMSISLDGTSSTTMIIDRKSLRSVTPPVLYNESRPDALHLVKAIAPLNHTVTSGTSTLCKLVSWWQANNQPTELDSFQMLHQADWLLALLHDSEPVTDFNNALKVGYDPGEESYPGWLANQPFATLLPRVVPPGTVIGPISKDLSQKYGIPKACVICSGTTDSIAAFLAAQPSQHGQAVTSLGSTLAVKLLSSVRVDDAKYGIYSHRLGDSWLVGGASNTGGAALKKIFSNEELRDISQHIDPEVVSELDYYPLPGIGERFPVSDPHMLPRLEPRPERDVEYLHGLLESMARIERVGYRLLQDLGASPLTEVMTAGGGSANATWTRIRERVLGVPVSVSAHTEAAYGSALLAKRAIQG